MKSSWRSPDGGSSVTPNTKIEPSEAVFCAWWSTASTPIRSFHTVSPLDFIHSGRIAKRFGQVLYELPRDFYRIGVCGRLAKSRVRPQLLSHQCQSIREGRAGFAVPRRLPDSLHASRHSLMGEQGNDREQ